VGWADRHMKGGVGIMVDDLIAGAMASILIYLALRLV
jgi:phosphatidylglycerophosphatase A